MKSLKLNEYIHKKLGEARAEVETAYSEGACPTENEIERWIFDWYQETYGRQAPMWLASRARYF
jgi:hypothetical protein